MRPTQKAKRNLERKATNIIFGKYICVYSLIRLRLNGFIPDDYILNVLFHSANVKRYSIKYAYVMWVG